MLCPSALLDCASVLLLPVSLNAPHVADVGEQHGEVAKPQSLLLGGQAQFGNGPDQSVDHRVQKPQQLVPALKLLCCLRGSRAQICSTTAASQTCDIHLSVNQQLQ